MLSRRQMLTQSATGVGLLGLAALLADDARAAPDPLAAHAGHFPARAKSVIWLYMPGGVSQVDSFDPKPTLTKYHGKPLPFDKPTLVREPTGDCYGSPFKFKQYGQSGLPVSELFPLVGERADDLCVVRSLVADNINHQGARLQMTTGEQTFSRPSLGSWLLYGLGSETRDLPGFVVLSPAAFSNGPAIWGSSFLPPSYQGTWVQDLQKPVKNLGNPRATAAQQRAQLDALAELNERHRQERADDERLSARAASFERAFRMQAEAPAVFDLSGESAATRALYGTDDPECGTFAKQCLLARRLVEKGVRMVQCFHVTSKAKADNNIWDQHDNLEAGHRANARASDRPIAGLLTDLKARGLLDSTLVVWAGEFGRTPTVQKANGREHNPFGFTVWLAGGGVKGGTTYGATDDFGYYAAQDKVHVHDLHATVLHAMGLDHEKLTYRHDGRDYRLTDVSGRVVKELFRG